MTNRTQFATIALALTLGLSCFTVSVPVCADTNTAVDTLAPEANTAAPGQADIQGTVQMNTTIPAEAAPTQTTYTQPAAPKRPEQVLVMTTAEDTAQKVGKEYKVLTITLKNTTGAHVEVLQAEVLNAVDEQVIAARKADKANNGRKVGSAFLRLGQAGLGFVPYAGVGLGGIYALSAANQVAGGAAHVMETTGSSAGAHATGQYVRRLNNVYISPNESYSFKALVPKKENAFFRVVFKDLNTNQILNYQI